MNKDKLLFVKEHFISNTHRFIFFNKIVCRSYSEPITDFNLNTCLIYIDKKVIIVLRIFDDMGIDRKYFLSFTLAVNDVTKKVEGIHQNVSMLRYTSLNILILFICMEY